MAAHPWCAVNYALRILGDRWTLGIIHELALGPRRTVELHRGFKGLSTKTLLERLRKLERAGLVSRKSFSESPPRVEYTLTARGEGLLPAVREIGKTARLWDEADGHGPECKACAALDESTDAASDIGPAMPGPVDGDLSQSGQPRTRQQIRKRDVTLL